MTEREIRKWYNDIWLIQDSIDRDYNAITRNKWRIVLLRDEINNNAEDNLYCKRLEYRIEKLLAELKLKEENIEEDIPGLDKALMRISEETNKYLEKDLKHFRKIEKILAHAGIMENYSREKHFQLVKDFV